MSNLFYFKSVSQPEAKAFLDLKLKLPPAKLNNGLKSGYGGTFPIGLRNALGLA